MKTTIEVDEATGGGYVARAVFKGQAYEITVRAMGPAKDVALARASAIASQIQANPILKALMPPQAQAAIAIGSKLATLARSGKLSSVLGRLKGPGARRLASALSR